MRAYKINKIRLSRPNKHCMQYGIYYIHLPLVGAVVAYLDVKKKKRKKKAATTTTTTTQRLIKFYSILSIETFLLKSNVKQNLGLRASSGVKTPRPIMCFSVRGILMKHPALFLRKVRFGNVILLS